MKKMKKILLLVLSFLLISSLFANCYATEVAVTKENLTTTFETMSANPINDVQYDFVVTNDTITVTVDSKEYTINYDLTEKPTFTYEVLVQDGMTYNDFKNQIDKATVLMVAYIAVANI